MLKANLIVTGKEYDQYTPSEHDMALAFRVLASAHLEDYAEQRCREVARAGIERLQRSQPSRAGRGVVNWFVVTGNGQRGATPLDPQDFTSAERLKEALNAYVKSVASTHGIGGRNLRHLVVRLGVYEADLDQQLFDALDALAASRGQAAHLRVRRARSMTEPEVEWKTVEGVLPLLEQLDEALTRLVAG